MLEFILFLTTVLIIRFLLVKFLRKRYKIIPYLEQNRYINKTHEGLVYIIRIIAIVFLILSFFIQNLILIIGFAISLCVGVGFQAFMEYKYEREEKEYIITLIDILVYIVLISGVFLSYFNGQL
ncbi:DUF4181 domain-containing protein [Ornithinibacillus californiensis]|uniref:DUF4181 domain-containing protein n=1 Tax=Ornithinibacillus californiensis TaxID=161536 RepID=UPI00064DD4A9